MDRSLSRFGEACRVSSKGKSEKTCDRLFQDLQKLLILEGTFDISEVFAVLLGRDLVTILYVCFRSTLVVFIFV